MREIAERETGADDRVLQFQPAGDADTAIVEECAPPLSSCEQVIAVRIVDDSLGQLTFLHQCDGYAILREVVQKIGGTVERVDDPDILGVLVAVAALLAQKSMGRIGIAQ